MRLNGVFTHKERTRDLTVAHALGHEGENLKFTGSDPEILSPLFVGEKRRGGHAGWNQDLFDDDRLARLGEPEAKPDPEGCEGHGDKRGIDLEGMLEDKEAILCDLKRSDQEASDKPEGEDMALHRMDIDDTPHKLINW